MASVDAGNFGQFFGIIVVVRDGVVGIRHADLRIAPTASLTREHERRHPCNVGLEGQHLQIEYQLDVIFEFVGSAEGTGSGRRHW